VPAVVGVPERAPAVERDRPAGSEPALTVKLYGVVPFTARTVALYAVPTVPAGRELVTMETGVSTPAPTFRLMVALALVPVASVTVTTKLEVTAELDGMPSRTPVDASVIPAGSEPEVTVKL
jgi:hypothetical protein